jgi:hypothetical protein
MLLAGSTIVALSCTKPSVTPAPAPGASPAPARTAAQGPGAAAARRPAPPSRDSLVKLRAVYVAQVMSQIAGRENQPAEQVFKNVQVLKGITAGELVQKMDKEYSVGLSWNCSNCHRFAAQGDFASDTSNNKVRARFMQQLVNVINTEQLPKLYPKNTPKVTCATCHRGYNEPPPAQYLIPERGQPGGPPAFGRRPGR